MNATIPYNSTNQREENRKEKDNKKRIDDAVPMNLTSLFCEFAVTVMIKTTGP